VLFQDDLVLKAGEDSPPGTGPWKTAGRRSRRAPFERPPTTGGRDLSGGSRGVLAVGRLEKPTLLDLARVDGGGAVRPGLRFALNLYYETVLNPRMALAWYAQDLGVARSRPFDYFSLMSYHRQIGRELSYTPNDAIAALGVLSRQAAAIAGNPARVIVKVQSLDWETLR
jgi:hypothetical protein